MNKEPRACLYCVFNYAGGCHKGDDGYCYITESTRNPTEDDFAQARASDVATEADAPQ